MSRGGHGAYRLWRCVTCGFGVPAKHWRRHRCTCLRVPIDSVCELCRRPFPCRQFSRKFRCPNVETPEEVTEQDAPSLKVVRSLKMKVKRLADGRWMVSAPWLEDSVIADTWPDAYWLAVKKETKT